MSHEIVDQICGVVRTELIRQADNAYGSLTAEDRRGSEKSVYLYGTFDIYAVAEAVAVCLGLAERRLPVRLSPTETTLEEFKR